MTHRNVGLGTSLADVVERYGEEEINEAYGAYTLDYDLGELKGEKFQPIDDQDIDEIQRIATWKVKSEI